MQIQERQRMEAGKGRSEVGDTIASSNSRQEGIPLLFFFLLVVVVLTKTKKSKKKKTKHCSMECV